MAEQFQALRELLADPAANFEAAAVSVAIVVIVFIVIALLLIALALPGRRESEDTEAGETEPSETTPRPKRRRLGAKGWLAVSALMIVGAVVSVFVWYGTTSSNRYCTTTCHSMAEPSESWRTSSHKTIDCVRCHEGKPWQSFSNGVSLRTYSLYLEMTGDTPRPMFVPSSRCLECHEPVMDKTFVGLNGESFTHREFADEMRCPECHGPQGHVAPGAYDAVPTP